MDFERHDDCNVVAKKTAGNDHVIISMDAVEKVLLDPIFMILKCDFFSLTLDRVS